MKQQKIKKIFVLLILLLLTTFKYTSAGGWDLIYNSVKESSSIKELKKDWFDLVPTFKKISLDNPELFTCIPHILNPTLWTGNPYTYSQEDIEIKLDTINDPKSDYCSRTSSDILKYMNERILIIKNNSNRTISISMMPKNSIAANNLQKNGLNSVFINWNDVKKMQHANEHGFIFESWNELSNIKPNQTIRLVINDSAIATNEQLKSIDILTNYSNINGSTFWLPISILSLTEQSKFINALDYKQKNTNECFKKEYLNSYINYTYEIQGYNENTKLNLIEKNCTYRPY